VPANRFGKGRKSSFARGWLAAGASQVGTSLWDIGDENQEPNGRLRRAQGWLSNDGEELAEGAVCSEHYQAKSAAAQRNNPWAAVVGNRSSRVSQSSQSPVTLLARLCWLCGSRATGGLENSVMKEYPGGQVTMHARALCFT